MTRTFNPSQPVPTHDPFKVPEGYFDTFADRMMARIAMTAPAAPVFGWLRWLPLAGAACVTALSLFFVEVTAVQGGSLGEASAWTEETSGTSYEDQAYDYMMMANAHILTDYESDY